MLFSTSLELGLLQLLIIGANFRWVGHMEWPERKTNSIAEETIKPLAKQSRVHSFKSALLVWSVWRALLSLWGFAIWRIGLIQPNAGREWLHGFTPAVSGARAALIDLWMRWDSVHYLRIIQAGYGPDERSAFFPLYPFLGKLFGFFMGGDNLLGLLLVSNLAAIGCFFLIDRLAQTIKLRNERQSVVANLVFFPSAFFLIVAYPQSLVLFFSLAAYAAQRKKQLAVSFLCGLAAGLTHSTALPVAVLLLTDAILRRRKHKLWFLTALGPVFGIGCFIAWRTNVGFPPYNEVQWVMSNRAIGLKIDLQGVMTPLTWLIRGWPNLLALCFGIGAIIWSYRRRQLDWFWFLLILIVIPIISAPGFEPLDGFARYLLVGFPVYLALSSWLPRGWKRLGLLSLAIGMNLYLSGLFIMWGFIG